MSARAVVTVPPGLNSAAVHVPYDAFSGGVELGIACGIIALVLGGVITFVRRASSS